MADRKHDDAHRPMAGRGQRGNKVRANWGGAQLIENVPCAACARLGGHWPGCPNEPAPHGLREDLRTSPSHPEYRSSGERGEADSGGVTLPPKAEPARDDDALLIDNLFRASLARDSEAIDTARMALRRRFNELRAAGVRADAPDWTDDAACLSGLADRLEEESATESDRGNDSAACAWTCRAYELRQIVSRMVRAHGVAACELCAKGFPLQDGQHYGTQALGMIPTTPCAAGVTASDATTSCDQTPTKKETP